MNIYVSHARKDSNLALELAGRLRKEGLTVVHPELEITPDGNWALKIGKALKKSDFMVFLLTPGTLEADWVRMDLEFALGSKKYEGRVFSVFIGPALAAGKEVPWILLKQPHRRLESADGFGKVAKEIAALCSATEPSSSNG
jgi:hypothetical protein